MKKERTNKPAFESRLNHIRGTVWENVGGDGRPWFNTTIARRYQDGETWKEVATFNGLADLALVAEVVRTCQDFIRRQEQQGSDSSEND